MARESNSTELFSRLGGEVNLTINGNQFNNTQSNLQPIDPGTTYNELNANVDPGINSSEFDILIAFFQRKGIPAQLARTYGIVLVEMSKSTGKDISEFFVNNQLSNDLQLNLEAIARMNFLRPKTSQLGFRTDPISANILLTRTILP